MSIAMGLYPAVLSISLQTGSLTVPTNSNMGIFQSYVELPEGIDLLHVFFFFGNKRVGTINHCKHLQQLISTQTEHLQSAPIFHGKNIKTNMFSGSDLSLQPIHEKVSPVQTCPKIPRASHLVLIDLPLSHRS